MNVDKICDIVDKVYINVDKVNKSCYIIDELNNFECHLKEVESILRKQADELAALLQDVNIENMVDVRLYGDNAHGTFSIAVKTSDWVLFEVEGKDIYVRLESLERDRELYPDMINEMLLSYENVLSEYFSDQEEVYVNGEPTPPGEISIRGFSKKLSYTGIVGLAEAADLLGWDKKKLSARLSRGTFPAPTWSLKATPLWIASDILKYKKDQDSKE